MTNCTKWRAPVIQLFNGTSAPSTSPEYRAQCEALGMLRKPHEHRPEALDTIRAKRGEQAVSSLKALMRELEPFHVLTRLPSKAARWAYLDKVRLYHGDNEATYLENRVRDLAAERKAQRDAQRAAS